MRAENPYRAIAAEYHRLLHPPPIPPLTSPPIPRRNPNAANVLLFSPHPDDECLTGGLPLRLLRESNYNILNFAVTLGSRPERQKERLQELLGACNSLGFHLILPCENGLQGINPATRAQQPELWENNVQIAARLLREYHPQLIFCPHARDRHPTHLGTHHLAIDALAQMDAEFSCWVVETEFWGAIEHPNLMVESSPEDVGDLMAATAFHIGEVQRNPYHLRLPAWMADNVRRGGELIGGQGAVVPAISFATLYRLGQWAQGTFAPPLEPKQVLAGEDNLKALFLTQENKE
jgi:LmbE family N-acetylglucosaminyl deacetylase